MGKFVPIFFAVLILIFCVYNPGSRIGDGAEYYAMFFAWKETIRPYATTHAWESYNSLTHVISGLQPSDSLINAFKPLSHSDQQDFNHFWLYSLLASIPSWALKLLGISISASTSFSILHASLAGILLFFSKKFYGLQGLTAALVIILLSPALWFMNKVHTEFFTITTTTLAFLFLWRKYLLDSSLFFALAGAQNPSFYVIALFPLLCWIFQAYKDKISLFDLIKFSLIVIIFAIHPSYYFFRYGALTPQLFYSGADLHSASLSKALVFLFDPDIGLFPNWPLGIIVLLASVIIGMYHKKRFTNLIKINPAFFICNIVFLLISLYAQSTTGNVNSGGTYHISRYAVWYLCMFYVPILLITDICISNGKRFFIIFLVTLATLAFFNTKMYAPSKPETYCEPSPASRFVWNYTPGFYTPPLEIFLERMGGTESSEIGKSNVIVAMDCKTIAYKGITQNTLAVKVLQPFCSIPLDPVKIKSKLFELASKNLTTSQVVFKADQTYGAWNIIRLTGNEVEKLALHNTCTSLADFSSKGNIPQVFMQGFSIPEDQGRWTSGSNATYTCSLSSQMSLNNTPKSIIINTTAFLNKNQEQHVYVSINKSNPIEFHYTQKLINRSLEISLPKNIGGEIKLQFYLPDAVSPKELGISNDTREIAINIHSIKFI